MSVNVFVSFSQAFKRLENVKKILTNVLTQTVGQIRWVNCWVSDPHGWLNQSKLNIEWLAVLEISIAKIVNKFQAERFFVVEACLSASE